MTHEERELLEGATVSALERLACDPNFLRLKLDTRKRILAGLARYRDPNREIELGDIVKYREVVDPSDATSLYVVIDDPKDQSELTKAGQSPARVRIKALGTDLPFPPVCTRNLDTIRLATADEIMEADYLKMEAAIAR